MPKYSKCDAVCQNFIFSLVAIFVKRDITKSYEKWVTSLFNIAMQVKLINVQCDIWNDVGTYSDMFER